MRNETRSFPGFIGNACSRGFQCECASGERPFLQTKDTWQNIIANREIKRGHNAGELYSETQDMNAFLKLLERFQVEYVDKPKEHSWGQRAVQFCDPDHYIIEVAEDLVMVIERFADSGMSVHETAIRMDVPVS